MSYDIVHQLFDLFAAAAAATDAFAHGAVPKLLLSQIATNDDDDDDQMMTMLMLMVMDDNGWRWMAMDDDG